MQPVPDNQLPIELQQITKIKTWYRASEYQNMLFLDAREEYYVDWGSYVEQRVYDVADSPEVMWLYGTEKCIFDVPDCEYLFEENIEESVFEGAWERVRAECKEEIIIIEVAIQVLAEKMERLNITGYKPNYKVGVVNI